MSRLDELYRMRASLAAEIYRLEAAQTVTPIRSGAILADAADLYGVGVEQVLSNSREDRVVKARQAACWLMRGFGLSFPRIGAIVGRDHTTVMHACTKIDNDPAIRAILWPILQREVAA
jgi:chromosomal replication initiation ATPase DnaA